MLRKRSGRITRLKVPILKEQRDRSGAPGLGGYESLKEDPLTLGKFEHYDIRLKHLRGSETTKGVEPLVATLAGFQIRSRIREDFAPLRDLSGLGVREPGTFPGRILRQPDRGFGSQR